MGSLWVCSCLLSLTQSKKGPFVTDVHENPGFLPARSIRCRRTSQRWRFSGYKSAQAELSRLSTKSLGVKRLTPAAAAAEAVTVQAGTSGWARTSITACWPRKAWSSDCSVKSLRWILTPDGKVEVEVGRLITVTLNSPVWRRADII